MNSTIDPKAELLRPAKFGRLIDSSPAHVYHLIQRGELHAVRVGGALRVPVSEIDRLKAEAISDEVA
jgi:excisionase family DNA binding protein